MIQHYYSFVYPYLIYGNLLWGATYEIHLKPLYTLQKKMICAMTRSYYNSHTTKLFKCNGILKLKDIHVFIVCQHMYSTTSGVPGGGDRGTRPLHLKEAGGRDMLCPLHFLGLFYILNLADIKK